MLTGSLLLRSAMRTPITVPGRLYAHTRVNFATPGSNDVAGGFTEFTLQ
jgi:hypothetical protein